MTARTDVLDAFLALEQRTGRIEFDLAEVIAEVTATHPGRLKSTVRTHVTSVMCVQAPANHPSPTNDLTRVARGRYRRTDRTVKPPWPKPVSRAGRPASSSPSGETSPTATQLALGVPKGWPWEGAVQAVYRDALIADGWAIVSEADTASRQQGHDLIASRDGVRRLVEVKGYPSAVYERGPKKGQPKPTQPASQARQWFSHAVLSGLLSAGDDDTAEVVLVFPDFPTYRTLARRVANGLAAAGVDIHLVESTGSIEVIRD